VANLISKSVTSLAAFALGAVMTVTAAEAQQGTRTVTGERYAPTIWVDPDGCEHWVMDDGFEGYMSPHTTRQGIPVCHRGNVCGVMNSDQFFATNSHRISASDEYNMKLSYNRANAVAAVAKSTGARIADVRGYGERMPVASNRTAGGMKQNRRVEIICVR